MPPLEGQPNPNVAPNQRIQPELKVSTVTSEPPADKDVERVNRAWHQAVTLTDIENMRLVDHDFTDPGKIKEDLKKQLGRDPGQAEVDAVIAERKNEQKSYLEDPSTVTEDERKIFFEMAQDDPDSPLHGKEASEPAVIEETNKTVLQHRNALKQAFEEMYQIDATVDAANGEINRQIAEELDKLKAAMLQVKQATDKNATLTAEEEAQLKTLAEKKSEGIRATVTPQYYDKDNGDYYPLGTDGKPDKTKPIHHNDLYSPVVTELKRMSKEKKDGEPTAKAKDAEKLLKELNYQPKEKAFKVQSQSEQAAKEKLEVRDTVLELAKSVRDTIAVERAKMLSVLSEAERAKVPPDAEEGNLSFFLEQLEDAIKTGNTGDVDFLTSCVTSAVTETIAAHNGTISVDAAKLDKIQKAQQRKDPKRDFVEAQLAQWGIKLPDGEVDTVITFVLSLGPQMRYDAKHQGQQLSKVQEAISKAAGIDGGLTAEQARALQMLASGGVLVNFRDNIAAQVGVQADKFTDIRAYLKGKTDTIGDKIAIPTDSKLTKPDIKLALASLYNYDEKYLKDLAPNLNDLKNSLLTKGIILAMLVSMFQGSMEFGTEDAQGPPRH